MPRKSKSKVNYASNVDSNRDGRTTRSEAAASNVDLTNPADLNDDVRKIIPYLLYVRRCTACAVYTYTYMVHI